MASIEPEALRVLSLDGGGIKGYTSLIILQRIFRTLQDIKPCDPPLKPCQVFDLIVGTSTGGLIAIMLGRLEMSIEEAINQYEVVGQKVFGQRPFFGKFANAIAGAPFYDIHILQECVKDVLKEKNIAPDEDFIVKDGIPSCRVKVCVTSKITSNVDALRSYRSVHPTIVNYDCTIWEAASATSAAPVFFKYVKFRTGDEFFDGGLRRNNPVEEALNECRQEKDLKDRELGCLISIGTGFHKIEGISSSLSRLLKAAVRMITDSQDTADRFLRSDEGLKLESSGRYFRFNVPQGMEDLRMDEHKETVRMRALTENYLHKMENGRMVAKCAEVLSKSDKLCSKADSPRKIKLHLDEIGTHYRLSCEECLKSLRFPMMDQWRRPSRESTSGTCSWLFQHKIFQDWLQCRDVQTHSGLIWISGKPGSGKSTLMLEAYRHVSKLQEPNKYCTAAFFFSAKTDSEQSNLLHSPEGLYRSLLHQLLPHHEEGLRRVVEAYKEKLTGVSSYKGYAVSWPEEELRKLFQSLFDESFAPRTVIFVDAMDECDSNRVRELAFFFRGLANRANLKGRKLDVCFSSTRVAVVNLGNCPSIVVEENNELDILLYLEENFVCDGTNNPRDFISLKNKIAEISSGVFLWVVLVVDLLLEELDKGRNIKYLEDERLPEVPRRLQDLFRDILSRIKEEDREISLHFFQWAILAGELRLKEWRHIFPFIGCHKPLSFAKATQSKLYSKTDEQLEKQIRHVSMGLFEVVGKTGQASSEGTDIDHDSIIGDAGSLNSDIGDTRVVDAIHLSVREFFVREGGFQILSPGLGFNAIGKGYISIMDTCLDYIGIQEFDCLERARQGTTSSLSSSSDSLGGVCGRLSSAGSYSSAGTERFHKRRSLPSTIINSSPVKDGDLSSEFALQTESSSDNSNMSKFSDVRLPNSTANRMSRCIRLKLKSNTLRGSSPPRDPVLSVDPTFLSYILATFTTYARAAEKEGANAARIILRLREGRMWKRWVCLAENIPHNTNLTTWAEVEELTSWVLYLLRNEEDRRIAAAIARDPTMALELIEEKPALNYCLDRGRSFFGQIEDDDSRLLEDDLTLSPEDSFDDVFSPVDFTSLRVQILNNSCSVSKGHYIPQRRLYRIMTRHTVERILRTVGHDTGDAQMVYDWFYAVLVILVIIEKPQSITDFVQQGVKDRCLPLISFQKSLFASIQGERVIIRPNGWCKDDFSRFYQQQWIFLVPFFARPAGEIYHYKFDNTRIILPILDRGVCQSYHRSISKVMLDPLSCNSSDFPLCNGSNWYIMHRSWRWKSFLCRAYAWNLLNIQSQRNANILPLLFTVETPKAYYLFFPWPSGCLYDLFHTNLLSNFNTPVWIAAQCWGISDSLAVLHQNNRRQRRGSKWTSGPRPIFLRRGHIMPSNVLWFRRTRDSSYMDTLVLSNFSFSHHFKTANYVAPELRKRTERRRYKGGERADIWGLACIFIEILRWYLEPLGWDPVTTKLYSDEDEISPSSHSRPDPIRAIHQHKNRTTYTDEFIEYIGTKMLTRDPKERATALEVSNKMKELHEKLQSDHSDVGRTTT